MVNIEDLLIKRIMLISHEHGVEMGTEEVRQRADVLSQHLRDQDSPSERFDALTLMVELIQKWK